jgi:type I restriction enzyme S subunit
VNNQLPENWQKATIEEIIGENGIFIDGDWIESKDQDPVGDVRLIQLADIGDGIFRNKSNRFLTYQKANELNCTFLNLGDVLLARMPDPLGRSCVFPGDSKRSVTAVDVCIIRPGSNSVSNRWLMYTINSSAFRAEIEKQQSGSTRKRISRSNLAKLLLPIPPLKEQNRTVEKIDELFTKLDAGVAALEKVRAQLKRYRQAVLKAAFSGQLTAEWREKHQGSDVATVLKPATADNMPDLPAGWKMQKLGEISKINSGIGFPLTYQGKKSGEIPFFKVGDISKNVLKGNIFLKESDNYILKEDCNKLKAKPLIKNTIVFAKIGEALKLNRRAILTVDSLVDNNVMGVSANEEKVEIFFLYYYFLTIKLDNLSRATTVPSVRKSDVENILLPIPLIIEQIQIVSEIERRFSIADEVEKTVENALKQAKRLRQSILKMAFEGRLVPQDPNDEPAEKLLERIRIEKQKLAKKGKN